MLFFAINRTAAQDNFKIFIPTFVPSNSSFEISLITSKKFPDADKLDIYLSPDISLNVNKILLLTQNQITQLLYSSETISDFGDQFRKISLNLSDTTKFSDDSFFQIIINLKSNRDKENKLKFFGKFYKGDKLLGYLENSDIKTGPDKDNIYNLTFQYYQKFPIAGNSLLLDQGSYLNVPVVYEFEEYLTADFWIKIKNPFSTILEIVNWETDRVEYYLTVNEHQMLVINSGNNNIQPSKPFFLSQNSWYHFKILFNKMNSEITFTCDAIELANYKILNDMDFENLLLHFKNESSKSEIYLEQLRLISINGDLDAVERNKNYIDFIDEKSKILLQVDFDESEFDDQLNNKTISYQEVKFVKSDAPIFLRSPEVNVNLSENYYEIRWEGGNYENASQYILERATGENDFIEIDRVTAVNDEKQTYSLISEKIEQPEIVYFRIKQINIDGSVVYSDVAKVGQGIVHDLMVGQNYPNPFNPKTLIQFELIQDSDVEVKVYNLAGKEIAILHKGVLSKGIHQFEFDGSGLSSGLYFYQITTPLSTQTRKMILAK
jgi:hypothetical protein